MRNLLLIFLIFFVCKSSRLYGQINAPLNTPAIGYDVTSTSGVYVFSYAGHTMGHYAIGWYYDTLLSSTSPSCWLSGYAGFKLFTDAQARITITESGNVGIGTTVPQSRLAVNGNITAKQVKVTQTGWPDYVFLHAYQLPDLSKIESFINVNHRLPDMPSAKEIETNGLDLGEMQKKQMQKIEELTLLLIRQQHEIDSLKSIVMKRLLTTEKRHPKN